MDVAVMGDEAWVVVDTDPSHEMLVHCARSPDGWVALSDQSWGSDRAPRPEDGGSEPVIPTSVNVKQVWVPIAGQDRSDQG